MTIPELMAPSSTNLLAISTRKAVRHTFYALVTVLTVGAPLIASAGTWQPLTNQPPITEIVDPSGNDYGPGGAAAPLLLTDGGVLVQVAGYYGEDARVFKLTPDINGSYIEGTWSQLASKPYIGSGSAQAVLADGRVIIEGGEYTGYGYDFTLTNQGAIYDPAANTWTSVAPPPFFVDLYPPRAVFAPNPIGDAASVVLPDGTFMLQDKMSRQAALLNLQSMTWTETGTRTKADWNDEEGWTLLPDGTVLTVDCYTESDFLGSPYPADPTHSEVYSPRMHTWSSGGSTRVSLTDPHLFETGPAVLRPNGTVFAVGSDGHTAIYDSHEETWSVGPTLPMINGNQPTAQDAPGSLLPDGQVLIAASAGATSPGQYTNPPVAFFQFNGKKLIREPTIPNAASDVSSSIQMVLLPTGQVLEVDGTNDVEIYTPGNGTPDPEWEPEIYTTPLVVSRGKTYELTGVRLNGMSQGTMFGDEIQSASNYPLVRITNLLTHHVFYSRTHDHSSMAVASQRTVSTHFDVPAGQEIGMSKLEVVANGVASDSRLVYVR